MKKTAAFVLVASALVAAGALKAKTVATEETLRQLNDSYVRSFVNHDMEWYRQHLSDDFLCTLSNGTVIDKTAFVSEGPSNVKSWKMEDVKIRVFNDDAALISAVTEFTFPDGTVRRSRYTDTYMKLDGKWKAVAAHLTRLP